MLKKRKKLWAMFLSAAMIITQLPAEAMAENMESEDTVADGTIASFSSLDSDVLNQTVEAGTELSELLLPDTVTAAIYHVTENMVTTEEESTKEDNEKKETNVTISEEEIPVIWNSAPVYDGSVEGNYIFTADVGGNLLSMDTKPPQITVTVIENTEQKDDIEQNISVIQPVEPLPCTKTEGCILEELHEGECVANEPQLTSNMVLGAEQTYGTPVNGDGYSFDPDTKILTISSDGGTTAWNSNSSIAVYDIEEIVIQEGVASIGRQAFMSCTNMVKVSFPETLTSIEEQAFSSCTSLENVTLPDGITYLPDSIFRNCNSLTNITFPKELLRIDNNAFLECSKLEEVNFPSKLTRIEKEVFNGCYSLSKVTFPSTLEYLGNSAFFKCTSLTEITLPNSLVSIGQQAFYESGLTSITIPEKVASVGLWAFMGCRDLKTVTFLGKDAPAFGDDIFKYITPAPIVYVLDGASGYESLGYETIYQTMYPDILSQPQDLSVVTGRGAVFNVEAEGLYPLSFLWQVDKGNGFADITDGTVCNTSSYTINAVDLEMSGWRYQCIITNHYGSATTNAAVLTVEKKEVTDIAVTGITAPKAGAAPDMNADVDGSAGYTAENITWKTGNTPVSGSFVYDTVYTVSVTLKAKQDYRFADIVNGTINGEVSGINRINDNEVILSYTFNKTDTELPELANYKLFAPVVVRAQIIKTIKDGVKKDYLVPNFNYDASAHISNTTVCKSSNLETKPQSSDTAIRDNMFTSDESVMGGQITVLIIKYERETGYSISAPLAAAIFTNNDRIRGLEVKEVTAVNRQGVVKFLPDRFYGG